MAQGELGRNRSISDQLTVTSNDSRQHDLPAGVGLRTRHRFVVIPLLRGGVLTLFCVGLSIYNRDHHPTTHLTVKFTVEYTTYSYL